MDIRTAIGKLLKFHGSDIGLNSQRKLADLTAVNPGQLSNWLANRAPLGAEKTTAVVQLVLQCAHRGLREKPDPVLEERIRQLEDAATAVHFGLGAEPAWEGGLVAPDSEYYVTRPNDEVLNAFPHPGLTALALVGGPMTGKSSALIRCMGQGGGSRSTLYLDLRRFIGRPTGEENFFGWIQNVCEAQLGHTGIGPVVFQESDDFSDWMTRNILPRATNRQCLLLLDHPETLPPETRHIIDYLLEEIVLSQRIDFRQACGAIIAYDPSHAAIQSRPLDRPFAEHFRWVDTERLSLRQVQVLAREAYTVQPHRGELLKFGGHPFLTQVQLAELEGKVASDTSVRAVKVVLDRIEADWPAAFVEKLLNLIGQVGADRALTLLPQEADRLQLSGLFALRRASAGTVTCVSEVVLEQLRKLAK